MSLFVQGKNSSARCAKVECLFGKEVRIKKFVRVRNLTNLKITIKNSTARAL